MNTVLVVDDEQRMLDLITSYLEKENFKVTTALNVKEMYKVLKEQDIDVVILDVMMPQIDGFTACKEIREFSNVPILMLTARGSEEDRVKGLKLGADDYIVKPFSPKELVARIEATLRRTQPQIPKVINIGDLNINKTTREVHVGEELINLTRREYNLLLFLVERKKQIFSREQLHEQIWGTEYNKGTLRTIDTHIKTLRFKLLSAGEYVKTVYGIGYKFEE